MYKAALIFHHCSQGSWTLLGQQPPWALLLELKPGVHAKIGFAGRVVFVQVWPQTKGELKQARTKVWSESTGMKKLSILDFRIDPYLNSIRARRDSNPRVDTIFDWPSPSVAGFSMISRSPTLWTDVGCGVYQNMYVIRTNSDGMTSLSSRPAGAENEPLLRCFVYIKQSFWALESPVMNSKSVQCTGPHLWHQKSCRQWVQAQIRRTNKDCYWYIQNRPTKLHTNDWNGWNPVKQCTPSSHKCARTGSPDEPGVKQVSLRVNTKVRS